MNSRKLLKRYKGGLKKNDIVLWTYKHHLNSKSCTYITKKGVFMRDIKTKRSAYSTPPEQYALVHFDGNKNPSRILRRELKRNTTSEKLMNGKIG